MQKGQLSRKFAKGLAAFGGGNKPRAKDESRFKYSCDEKGNWVATPLEFNVSVKCGCQLHE